MSPTQEVMLIAATWAGAVGVLGGAGLWLMRRASLRWQVAIVALVAVGSVVAGMIGTARAMFLSQHDFGVVLVVCAVAGLVSILVAAGVGSAFVAWANSLRRGAREFGVSGLFAAPDSGPAEWRALSDELAATSARLAQAQEREARLETSRRELVSWVSHDLRTPLAGMRAMAEALEDGMATDPPRYFRQIRVQADRMARQVDDLFELSRIHAGVLNLSVQRLALGDVVSEVIAEADPVARSRGVHLDGSVEPGILVAADPAGLSRVVANLVTNAIRHTPTDGTVQIVGRAVPEGVELSVTDSCGGIPSDELDRVFEVAWQGTAARTPEVLPGATSPGGGLGLAIVQGLVEAHRGSVQVENHGRGCRFRVFLPA